MNWILFNGNIVGNILNIPNSNINWQGQTKRFYRNKKLGFLSYRDKLGLLRQLFLMIVGKLFEEFWKDYY